MIINVIQETPNVQLRIFVLGRSFIAEQMDDF